MILVASSLGTIANPLRAQSVQAMGQRSSSVQQTATRIDEVWLQTDFIDSARNLFERQYAGTLRGAELRSWADQYTRPLTTQFKLQEKITDDAIVTKAQLDVLWEQVVQLLVKAGYVAYPGIGEPNKLGKIVRTTRWHYPLGATTGKTEIPVLYVKPFPGTAAQPYTRMSHVVIPDEQIETQIRTIWKVWDSGYAAAYPRPPFNPSLTPAQQIGELGQWLAIQVIGPERNMARAREIVEQVEMLEEGNHYVLFHYLEELLGTSIFAMEPDALLDAMAKHLINPNNTELIAGLNAAHTASPEEKMRLINLYIELPAQLYTLSHAPQPLLAFMTYARPKDIVHATVTEHMLRHISPGVFPNGQTSIELDEWVPELIGAMTKSLPPITSKDPGNMLFEMHQRLVKKNITDLNHVLERAASSALNKLFIPNERIKAGAELQLFSPKDRRTLTAA